MKKILILGAGRSATFLIKYLEKYAAVYQWMITVGDKDVSLLKGKAQAQTRIITFDLFNEVQREEEINNADMVVSLLPAALHPVVGRTCLKYNKSLFTASYESVEMKSMAAEVKEKGLLFLNEMGLDPGIDHMSAMRIIDRIKGEGHDLKSFESFTGGLVAPGSDDNPWHYKFSWNPRNVVVAGQGGPAKFIQEGKYKYIPYNRLFRRTELIDIEGYGRFEGYANRDSLKYIDCYNLQGVPTVYRGTLRRPGYCKAWNVFVQLGLTDDTYELDNTEEMTYREYINSFLYYHPADSVKTKLFHYMHIDQDSDIIDKLEWLGIFEDKKIGLKKATPAQVLEKILREKWQLMPEEKDMIVMWHKFIYEDKITHQPVTLTSSLVSVGENGIDTAMAKTVGLPLAIATKLYLTGQLRLTGVHIPTIREIYEPILDELRQYDIAFVEKEKEALV
ncbi:saccharopine dehydrogenase [Marinilabiliaceae bacterium JC017]|nr:saccharopine dehydrogenase [Marinilabiliaceae bacterium JC017]